MVTTDISGCAFDIVAIGASLGGIEAVGRILSVLPEEFPVPIVLLQHIASQYPSHLAEVLGNRTRLSVRQAMEGEPLQPGTVYTPVPGHHVVITPQRTLSLVDGPKVNFARPSLDPLFHSVAAAFAERAIGVVLTGANGDGADGIRTVKQSGGTTIAQDAATSQASRMPRAAIDTGCVNFVLPIHRIAHALIALTMMEGASAFFTVPASGRYPIVN